MALGIHHRVGTFNRNRLPEMDRFGSVSDMAILPNRSLLLISMGIGSVSIITQNPIRYPFKPK